MFKYVLPLLICAGVSAAPLSLEPDAKGFPQGWNTYGKGPGIAKITKKQLRIADQSDVNEWGIRRIFPSPAPGKYEITVEASGNLDGSQMVIIPAGQKLKVLRFADTNTGEFEKFIMQLEIPAGCKNFTLYIYGSYNGKPDFLIRSIDIAQVKEFTQLRKTAATGNPPPPPVIQKLKPLYRTTPLKEAVIAAGNTPDLQQAARELAARFGSKIVPAETISIPLKQHVIALGNRINNPFIDKLYKRGFCYTDKIYPGKGGYELRSIHNPTGGGWNVILCGGSEDAGAVQAAGFLKKGSDTANVLMKLHVPGFDKSKVDPANASHYYTIGTYYGWNYISGVLALFYQTGDTFYAGEFLRLAFPDAQAIRDFKRFNAESIELPNDPLAGPYHYAAHHMILLWDLVEEHPFFTDKQRLDITNAFARQWKHHVHWTRPVNPKSLTTSSRHGQWAQISNYALGRYFMRDYPAPAWENAIARAESEFAVANKLNSWIEGERGIVSWFVSGSINPACQFFGLSGGAEFNPDGALANALRFMQTQWDGSRNSEILGTAYRQTFHLAAEHTGDGKYLWFANLLAKDQNGFYKFGASYAPTGKLQPRPPTELLNTWTTAPMMEGERRFFRVTAPKENCFLGLGWRNTLDTTGDWISFNCFNESYRTPFKLLSLSGLRLDGVNLLHGFGNYVQPTQSGVTAREIPTVGQVYHYGQAGETVYFSGGVPDHAFSAWQRDLLLRNRTFVLLADTITPAEKSGLPLTIQINMQTKFRVKSTQDGKQIQFAGTGASSGDFTKISALKHKGVPACPVSSGARNTLFETSKIGDKAVIYFQVPQSMTCNPALTLYDHDSRAAALNVYLDGKKILSNIPHFSATSELAANTVHFGTQKLNKGEHVLELEVAATSSQSAANWIGVGHLALNAGAQTATEIQPVTMTVSDGEIVLKTGSDAAIKRNMDCDPAKPVTTFQLFSRNDPDHPVKGGTVADNAALFQMPAPLLVFCRELAGVGKGTLVTVEKDRISGQGVTKLGTFFAAEHPVGLDWEFGKLLQLSGKPGSVITINGQKYTLDNKGSLQLSRISPADKTFAARTIKNALQPVQQSKQSADGKKVKPVPAKETKICTLPANIQFIRPVRAGFLAGAGNNLLLLDKKYRIKQQWSLSAPVQCAVQAENFLIAGTKGEEIAAFDMQGKKCWSFTSVLAPEVEATQKYYWFKKPYPGIFALEYKAGRIYAGSACTMEVLDLNGKLLGRYPQTWGPCRQISIVDQPDGSHHAVGLRHSASDGVYMWTVNSKTGKNVSSFSANVPGYRHFPSFGSLQRTKAFVDDFNGDGKPELLADAQGLYTWLNLYNAQGVPQKQVNLGPGKVIRTWTTGNFTGDARPEILVATWSNQLLAIDGECRPLWTADIPCKGTHLAVNSKTQEIIVSDMQTVCKLNGAGKLLAEFRLESRINDLWCSDGKIYVTRGNRIFFLEL